MISPSHASHEHILSIFLIANNYENGAPLYICYGGVTFFHIALNKKAVLMSAKIVQQKKEQQKIVLIHKMVIFSQVVQS